MAQKSHQTDLQNLNLEGRPTQSDVSLLEYTLTIKAQRWINPRVMAQSQWSTTNFKTEWIFWMIWGTKPRESSFIIIYKKIQKYKKN